MTSKPVCGQPSRLVSCAARTTKDHNGKREATGMSATWEWNWPGRSGVRRYRVTSPMPLEPDCPDGICMVQFMVESSSSAQARETTAAIERFLQGDSLRRFTRKIIRRRVRDDTQAARPKGKG